MDEDKQAAIRSRAYQLWQDSGEAHGRHEEHWRQAEDELEGAGKAPTRQNDALEPEKNAHYRPAGAAGSQGGDSDG